MRAHASLSALALFSLLALPGCDKPDVGARCRLAWNEKWQRDNTPPPPTPTTAEGAYFESGNTDCDDLICIVSPVTDLSSKYATCAGGACGYCSKPCVSDRDCYSSSTGLKCQQVILDPAFIALLDPATRARYLSDISFSNYCVVPQ